MDFPKLWMSAREEYGGKLRNIDDSIEGDRFGIDR